MPDNKQSEFESALQLHHVSPYCKGREHGDAPIAVVCSTFLEKLGCPYEEKAALCEDGATSVSGLQF